MLENVPIGKVYPVVKWKGQVFIYNILGLRTPLDEQLKPLTPNGIEGLEIHDNTSYGLCNKPVEMGNPFGTVTADKDKELIDSLPEKKKKKREKRA